jgi:hypothetical protein
MVFAAHNEKTSLLEAESSTFPEHYLVSGRF